MSGCLLPQTSCHGTGSGFHTRILSIANNSTTMVKYYSLVIAQVSVSSRHILVNDSCGFPQLLLVERDPLKQYLVMGRKYVWPPVVCVSSQIKFIYRAPNHTLQVWLKWLYNTNSIESFDHWKTQHLALALEKGIIMYSMGCKLVSGHSVEAACEVWLWIHKYIGAS